MRAGVIGYPITHSKSPIIHNYWMAKNNIIGTYEAIEVLPERLKEDVRGLVDKSFDGFNVTVPYKEKIITLCDELDTTAKKIGAVNTVVIKNKKLVGANTDAYGFIENIKLKSNFDFTGKNIFVLGAGGAAKAVLYGLKNEGVSTVKIANRSAEKVEDLAALYPDITEVVSLEKTPQAIDNIDLFVNTTSLGMSGQSALDIDLERLPGHAIVHDIVYAPLVTDLLKQARARGHKTITGIGMLLHQARPAFEAWTGILPEVTSELEEIILK